MRFCFVYNYFLSPSKVSEMTLKDTETRVLLIAQSVGAKQGICKEVEEVERENGSRYLWWVVHCTWASYLTSNLWSYKREEKHISGSRLIHPWYPITLTQRNGPHTQRNLSLFILAIFVLFFPNSSQKSQISNENLRIR